MKTVLTRLTALAAVGLFALTACSSPAGGDADEDSGSAPVELSAAASLTDVIDELEAEYRKQDSDFELRTNVGASSKLVQQINEGQKAQLLITADEVAIESLDESLNYSNEGRIATNRLVLAVNGDWVTNLEEHQREDLDYLLSEASVAICAPDVPCGRNTQAWLEHHQPENFTARSEEDNVRNTLAKVTAGEVDAGFVYATDQAAAADSTVAVPLEGAEVQGYPLMIAPDASAAARDFGAWLRSEVAQQILQDHGFGAADAH